MKEEIRKELAEHNLKVTLQRVIILETIRSLHNHPTAEYITSLVQKEHPNVSQGTIYKVLDTLVTNGLIIKLKTGEDVMRYDGDVSSHHHLFSSDSNEIGDYRNEELDQMLKNFFEKHPIKDFDIQNIRLSINGDFNKKE